MQASFHGPIGVWRSAGAWLAFDRRRTEAGARSQTSTGEVLGGQRGLRVHAHCIAILSGISLLHVFRQPILCVL